MDYKEIPFLKLPNVEIIVDEFDTYLFCVPTGWKAMFIDACSKIYEYIKNKNLPLADFSIADVKEKYGQLIICSTCSYNKEDADYIENILLQVENNSFDICSDCGEKAEYISTGYILPYCKCCAEKEMERFKKFGQDLIFNKVFRKK